MPVTVRDHLANRANRTLIILLADTPLDEDDVADNLLRYGSIVRIDYSSNKLVAFVQFECEHAPLLLARCFPMFEEVPPRYFPFPRGVITLLPGCSINNFLFLQHVPRTLSTAAIHRHFSPANTQEIFVHRPITIKTSSTGQVEKIPSSRVVVQLGRKASDYVPIQHRSLFIFSILERGRQHQLHAVPELSQLVDSRDICDRDGCDECNMDELRPLIRLQDEYAEWKRAQMNAESPIDDGDHSTPGAPTHREITDTAERQRWGIVEQKPVSAPSHPVDVHTYETQIPLTAAMPRASPLLDWSRSPMDESNAFLHPSLPRLDGEYKKLDVPGQTSLHEVIGNQPPTVSVNTLYGLGDPIVSSAPLRTHFPAWKMDVDDDGYAPRVEYHDRRRAYRREQQQRPPQPHMFAGMVFKRPPRFADLPPRRVESALTPTVPLPEPAQGSALRQQPIVDDCKKTVRFDASADYAKIQRHERRKERRRVAAEQASVQEGQSASEVARGSEETGLGPVETGEVVKTSEETVTVEDEGREEEERPVTPIAQVAQSERGEDVIVEDSESLVDGREELVEDTGDARKEESPEMRVNKREEVEEVEDPSSTQDIVGEMSIEKNDVIVEESIDSAREELSEMRVNKRDEMEEESPSTRDSVDGATVETSDVVVEDSEDVKREESPETRVKEECNEKEPTLAVSDGNEMPSDVTVEESESVVERSEEQPGMRVEEEEPILAVCDDVAVEESESVVERREDVVDENEEEDGKEEEEKEEEEEEGSDPMVAPPGDSSTTTTRCAVRTSEDTVECESEDVGDEERGRDSDDLLSGEEEKWMSAGRFLPSPLPRSSSMTSVDSLPDVVEQKEEIMGYDVASGDAPSLATKESDDSEGAEMRRDDVVVEKREEEERNSPPSPLTVPSEDTVSPVEMNEEGTETGRDDVIVEATVEEEDMNNSDECEAQWLSPIEHEDSEGAEMRRVDVVVERREEEERNSQPSPPTVPSEDTVSPVEMNEEGTETGRDDVIVEATVEEEDMNGLASPPTVPPIDRAVTVSSSRESDGDSISYDTSSDSASWEGVNGQFDPDEWADEYQWVHEHIRSRLSTIGEEEEEEEREEGASEPVALEPEVIVPEEVEKEEEESIDGEEEEDTVVMESIGEEEVKQKRRAFPPSFKPVHSWLSRTEVDSDDEMEEEEVEEGRDEEDFRETLASPVPVLALISETNNDGEENEEVEQRVTDCSLAAPPQRRWSRSTITVDHEEEEDYRSVDSEYHRWLTREERVASGDASSDTEEEEHIPLPSSLDAITWGEGIVIEEQDTVANID